MNMKQIEAMRQVIKGTAIFKLEDEVLHQLAEAYEAAAWTIYDGEEANSPEERIHPEIDTGILVELPNGYTRAYTDTQRWWIALTSGEKVEKWKYI